MKGLSIETQNKLLKVGYRVLRKKIVSGVLMEPFMRHRNDTYLSEKVCGNTFDFAVAGNLCPGLNGFNADDNLRNELGSAFCLCGYAEEWDAAYFSLGFDTVFVPETFAIPHEYRDRVSFVRPQSYKIFKLRDFSAALIFVKYDSTTHRSELAEYVRRTSEYLAGKGVAYVATVLKYDCSVERIAKTITKMSHFCADVTGIGKAGNAAAIDSADTAADLGSLIPEKSQGAVIYRRTVRLNAKSFYDMRRYYVPVAVSEKDRTLTEIIPHDECTKDIRREIARGVGILPEKCRQISVGKMLDIIGVPMPSEYAGYADMPLDDFVVYPFQIRKKNTVLFFRDYEPLIHEMSEKGYYNGYIGLLRCKMVKYGRVFVVSPKKLPADIPHVVVDNVLAKHGVFCKYLLSLYDLDYKVAITGSIGKTTCKEMAQIVLGKKYETLKSPDNENLQLQMSSVFSLLNPKYNAYIQEMGGGMPGRAESFAKVIEPDAGIVTTIGTAHLRFSKSREALAFNKTNISNGIRNGGPLLVNFDNDKLQDVDYSGRNIITYAIDNHSVDYYAENIKEENESISFDIVHGDKVYPATLGIPGRHNVYNALTSFIIGEQAGVPYGDIIDAIAEFRPEGIRQHIETLGGYRLFIDCFNASVESMTSSVKTLANLKDSTRKIAFLADMTGLGDESAEYHATLGRNISGCDIDYLIGYGTDIRNTCENFKDSNAQIFCYEDVDDAVAKLEELLIPGTVILFKGSSKSHLERDVIDRVFGTSYTRLSFRHKRVRESVRNNTAYHFYFRFIDACGLYDEGAKTIELADGIEGRPVRAVEDGAFEHCDKAETVRFSSNLLNIGARAFGNCSAIRSLELPESLKIIYDEAFENCVSLESVRIGREVIHIGERAFAGCTSLKKVELPATLGYIAENAFEGCGEIEYVRY